MKHNFKNLNIWKLSLEIASDVYNVVDHFPKSEEFGLKSQLSRCAVSTASNIAEGSSRNSVKEFNRFLEIAIGSLYEMQTQLIIAKSRNYLTALDFEKIEDKIIELQKMISGFQRKILSGKMH